METFHKFLERIILLASNQTFLTGFQDTNRTVCWYYLLKSTFLLCGTDEHATAD